MMSSGQISKCTGEDSAIPKKVIDILYGFCASQSLFTACELGIFDVLHTAGVPQSASKIAEQLSTNQDATSRLLDVLVNLELLVKQTGAKDEPVYTNSPLGKLLTKESPSSLLDFAAFVRDIDLRHMNNLSFAVREGTSQWHRTFNRPTKDLDKNLWYNQEALFPFLQGMRGNVKLFAPIFMTAFDLNRFKRMCDLGGGTGDVAYAACVAYPNMQITVLDLQPVVQNAPHFKPSMEEFPNQKNVSFVAGDFFEPTLPAADLYVLTHILHLFTDKKVDMLLANIYASLPSGGGVLIGDILLFDDKSGPLLCQYMSLVMLLASDGRERSGQEYKQLLEKHGFKDVQWKFTQTNSLDAVLAIKP